MSGCRASEAGPQPAATPQPGEPGPCRRAGARATSVQGCSLLSWHPCSATSPGDPSFSPAPSSWVKPQNGTVLAQGPQRWWQKGLMGRRGCGGKSRHEARRMSCVCKQTRGLLRGGPCCFAFTRSLPVHLWFCLLVCSCIGSFAFGRTAPQFGGPGHGVL